MLGKTGKNFAAGMSGGIAYVFDECGDFPRLCNREMVELTRIEDDEEAEFVKSRIFRHIELTESRLASEILGRWERNLEKFVRIIPHDYRRVIETQKRLIAEGLSQEEAEMSAFEKVISV